MADINRPIYVVGHKNPDTDSVCAAIAYANLKNQITNQKYEAKRAGHLNEETQFVLKRFGVESPQYIKDVRTQVKDMEIRELKGGSEGMSLKKAWETMKDAGVVTLCVTKGQKLQGLITTGDIVTTYMDVYDADILSKANTGYKNIVETLDGTLLMGSDSDKLTNGKVVIAAASPELLEDYIEKDDVVILGNRYETQLCAIEMEAQCIIVCEGAKVASTILKQAEEHNCKVISTPHDTFTVARLINQSMPISFFMKKDDLVSFHTNDFIEDIQQIMAQMRHRYFPVLDENDNYVGMISRRNFLGARKKQIILVDHNEKNQAVEGMEQADILEIIDHHRLGTVQTAGPVFFRNQPLGSTCTIIYLMYKENGVEISPTMAGIMLSAILSDTLVYRSPTCTEVDKRAGAELAKIAGIEAEEYAKEMFRAGSNLGSKTPTQIIHQDFKKFTVDDQTIAIGQINSMSTEELEEIKAKVVPELESTMKADSLDMIFFMLTNILKESSEVVFAGNRSEVILENSFNVKATGNSVNLQGVVSRKKQILPAIVEALQQ